MIPLGLTADEQAEFHKVIKGLVVDPATGKPGIDIRFRVHLLDMEEKYLSDLSSWLVGGQVVVDSTAEVSRSCQLSLIDPGGRAGIDPETPGTSTHLDRMISVNYCVWVAAIGDAGEWVNVPVFRGPMSKVSRDGDVIEVEALGKEHLLRADAGWSHTYAAGLTRTGVIRDILIRSGERRYVVPSWKPKTGKSSIMPKIGTPPPKGFKRGGGNGSGDKRNLWDRSHPWTWILAIARSMRAQVWFDGGGTFRMRLKPTRSSWTFTEPTLLSLPKITVDDEEVFNHVLVIGAPPEGKKGVVESYGSIPASHPNSVQALGRNGVYRYLVDTIEDGEIRTTLDADKARDRRLNELVVETYTVEFECLTVPHLDAGDLCRLAWDEAPGSFRATTFTIPLTGEEPMSVGYSRETRRTPAMNKAAAMRRKNRAKEARRQAVARRQTVAKKNAAKVKSRNVKKRKKAGK